MLLSSSEKKPMIYHKLAKVYDRLMWNVPYEKWIDYVEAIFRRFDYKPHLILDLACGTGNTTIPWAKRGYEAIGVDISEEMLKVARDKAAKADLNIEFIQQDMKELRIEMKIEAVVCLYDSLNYLLSEGEIVSTFERVSDILPEGGFFIFDLNTEYQLISIFKDGIYTEDFGDFSYYWESSFDEVNKISQVNMTFSLGSGKEREVFTEIHQERSYGLKQVKEMLTRTDFQLIAAYSAYTFFPPNPTTKRIFYIACKGVE